MLNMMDDDLNPYQYRLLGHYKRVCGEDGACWEGVRKTAKTCRMSTGKVSQTRRELETLGYIKTQPGENDGLLITIIDRWAENVARYSKRSYSEHPVHGVNTSVHTVNTPVHDVNERITLEEEPIKKSNRAPKKTEREILVDQLQPHLALAHEILTAHEPGYRGMYTSILEYCTAYDALKEWTDVVIGLSERRSPPRPGEFASYYRDLTTYYAARQWQVGRKTIREQWDNWRAGKFSPGGSAGTSDWQITPAPALPDVGLTLEDRQQMVESTRKQRIGGV